MPSFPEGIGWARVNASNDFEIERMAANDPDNPATKAEYWAGTVVGIPPDKANDPHREGVGR